MPICGFMTSCLTFTSFSVEGLMQVWARITVDGKRSQCSIKKQVTDGQWDEETNSLKRYLKFVSVLKKTQAFIKHKYKRIDVLLEQAKLNFLTDLQHYLRTVDRISHNSSMKYCKDLR
jgi:hypothetical protein